LHLAVQHGNIGIIDLLLQNGADITLTDCWLNTPFHYTMHSTFQTDMKTFMLSDSSLQKIITLILAKPKRNMLGISLATHLKSLFDSQFLLNSTNELMLPIYSAEPYVDILGNTELHYIVGVYCDSKVFPVSRDIEVSFQYAIERKRVSICASNNYGQTSLHAAHGREAIQMCLRQGKFDLLTARDNRGRTFLHLYYFREAANRDVYADSNVLEILISADAVSREDILACMAITDDMGRTPIHYAAMGNENGSMILHYSQIY